MIANARIIAIDYNPPGRDVQGEHVVIQNFGTTPLDMKDWTLRDAAPTRPHVYTFKQFSLPPGGQVRVWTKAGNDTSSDVFWGLGTAVWNNIGDIAVLRDANGIEASRFAYLPLPGGAVPLRIAVPAFWTLEPKYDQTWQSLKQAGSVVDVTVISDSWPEFAAIDSSWRDTHARPHLDSLAGTVLGYVSTRVSPAGPLRSQAEILEGTGAMKMNVSVKAWYDQFGQQIDGIYFDELVIPEQPGDITTALSIVSTFKAAHPTAKVMILAGQCPDDRVVGPEINWALLWEDTEPAYRQNFLARVNMQTQKIPSWWKNPAYRQKIAHVVHDCNEPDRQGALSLANERNAGHVFVMGRRGNSSTDPNNPKYELYNNLPPYWNVEAGEADSYYDFGFDPLRVLLAARLYGVSQGKFHAWPNFEAAWYSSGHVRGTFLLAAGPHAVQQDVLQTALPGMPSLFDIPAVWSAAHQYAQTQGYKTALPTFEQIQTAGGLAFRLILFTTNSPWLTSQTVPVASTYQQPTFAEPGAVVRNIYRWAINNGYKASFPTFVPDNAAEPRGRTNFYNCYVLSNAASVVQWQDVPTVVYLQQL